MDSRFPTSEIDEIGSSLGLLNYYNCDVSDNNTLFDNSGNNNTASIYNISLSTGVSGNAISLNGTSSYLEAGYANSTAFTLSCWYKGTYSGSSGISLFSLAKTSNTVRIGMFIDSSGYLSMINTNSSGVQSYLNSNTAINNNAWHFCAITADGSNAYIYVDGIQKNTVAVSLTTDYYNLLRVGKSLTTDFCSGLIDGIRLYNRALTAIEIKQLYKLNYKKTSLFTDNYESSINYNQIISLSNYLEGTSVKNDVDGSNLGVSSNITQGTDYFDFNGTTSYINIGDSARLNVEGSISLWYYARSSGENNLGRLIDKSTDTNGTNGYAVYLNDNLNINVAINGTLGIIQSSSLPSINVWHHLVVVLTSSKKELWIDGIKVTSNTNTSLPPNVSGNVFIGNRADNSDRTFDGYIKNVRIYTRSLKTEEIKFLYNKVK